MSRTRTRTPGTKEQCSINIPVELKPYLIDLEALTRATGGKRKQPERLNDKGAEKRMRQSEHGNNVNKEAHEEAPKRAARLERGHESNRMWNVYSDVATQGTTLTETNTMPETQFTITQGTLTITEYGNSVKKLAALIFSFMNSLCPKVVGFAVA